MRTTRQQKTMFKCCFCKVKFWIQLMVRLLVRPQIKCMELNVTECILPESHVSTETDLTVHFLVIPAAPWNFLKRLIIQFVRGGINFLIPFVRGWFPPCFLDTFWIVIMSLHQLLLGWELSRINIYSFFKFPRNLSPSLRTMKMRKAQPPTWAHGCQMAKFGPFLS